MKITPLNYSYTNKMSKTQNFEGLWGKTSKNSDIEQSLGITKVEEVCYYYPFEDETAEDIQCIVEENTEAYIDESESVPKYKVKECKVCTTLPFNELSYLNYATLSPKAKLSNKVKIVHACAKDKYTTNEFGPSQESAVNEAVARKLDANV